MNTPAFKLNIQYQKFMLFFEFWKVISCVFKEFGIFLISKRWKQLIQSRGRAFIFSTSTPVPIIAAAHGNFQHSVEGLPFFLTQCAWIKMVVYIYWLRQLVLMHWCVNILVTLIFEVLERLITLLAHIFWSLKVKHVPCLASRIPQPRYSLCSK